MKQPHASPISISRIRAAARQVAHGFHPRAIILFGSQTTGTARAGSDDDWLVIAQTMHPLEFAARILVSLNGRFPLDVLVRTPGEVPRALRGQGISGT